MLTTVEGREIKVTNAEKLFWPEMGITKLDYIKYLVEVAPFMVAYTKNRLLTTIRFPDGINGKSFYQKNIPRSAPEWIATFVWSDTEYILLNDLPTLVWLANQACLEIHVSFHMANQDDYPTELVFDLDPSDVHNFTLVRETALQIKEIFDALGIRCIAKTSGATGLQIYVPIQPKYTFQETRRLGEFIARYIAEKNPQSVTLERLVKNRGSKLYIDYLQHWKGKTLAAPYTARSRAEATVSAPVTWPEVEKGIHPTEFTMLTMPKRIRQVGDLFRSITTEKNNQSLDDMLSHIMSHSPRNM